MLKASAIATIFIALCAMQTSAFGQKIYRCGNTYSESPCPGGIALDSPGTPNPAQKAAADQATQREAAAASKLEKSRLTQETQQGHERLAAAKVAQKAEKEKRNKELQAANAEKKAAKKKAAKKAPEYFTATPKADKKSPAQGKVEK
jgi:hypothetical protein